jgi:hypothetical protein
MTFRSSYFEEIFGSDLDSIAPIVNPKPEPVLPMDDPTHDFSKATKTRAIDRLQDSAFVSEIVGSTVDAAGLVSMPSAQKTISRKSASFPANFMEEILPTADALASFAPNAESQFGELIKTTRTPRKKPVPICWTCMETVNECKCEAA